MVLVMTFSCSLALPMEGTFNVSSCISECVIKFCEMYSRDRIHISSASILTILYREGLILCYQHLVWTPTVLLILILSLCPPHFQLSSGQLWINLRRWLTPHLTPYVWYAPYVCIEQDYLQHTQMYLRCIDFSESIVHLFIRKPATYACSQGYQLAWCTWARRFGVRDLEWRVSQDDHSLLIITPSSGLPASLKYLL